MIIRITMLILIYSLGFLTANNHHAIIPNSIAQEIDRLLTHDSHVKKTTKITDPYFKSLLTLIDKTQALECNDSYFNKMYKNFFYNTFHGPAIEAEFPKGIILLSSAQAPHLHATIEELCTKLAIAKPLIFLTCSKKVYNACASSLSTDTALIVIGQKLIKELPEEELKAVLAHELSHIKRSHASKKILCAIASSAATAGFIYWLAQDTTNKPNHHIQATTNQKISEPKKITSYLNYPSVKIGIFGLFCIAYHLLMMQLSQEYETEADMLALQTTEDPENFWNMLESIKGEVRKKINLLDEEYRYVTEHLKIIAETSPDSFKSISSNAFNHYESTKKSLQNILNGDGSTHPSLENRQKIVSAHASKKI